MSKILNKNFRIDKFFDNSRYNMKTNIEVTKNINIKYLKNNDLERSSISRSRHNRIFMDNKISVPYLFGIVR